MHARVTTKIVIVADARLFSYRHQMLGRGLSCSRIVFMCVDESTGCLFGKEKQSEL